MIRLRSRRYGEAPLSLSVVIAGGGTGGHVYPGIALAHAIAAAEPSSRIAFAGTARGMETRAVPAAGFDLELIDVLPWARTIGAKRFLAPASAIRAAAQAKRILANRKADVVVGMGGYASLPVALAARMRRIPIVVHEQNAIPGRANVIAARMARKVAATFAGSVRYFRDAAAVRVIGNPLRESIATMNRDRLRPEAMSTFGLDPARKTLLVAGGSQGARRLTDTARGLAQRWRGRDDRQIVMIAGPGNAQPAADPSMLHEIEFTDRMDLAYAAADAVVCRAGAGIMEVACASLPAILVPYPYARDDHQRANATEMANAGAAIIVADQEATAERIDQEVARLFDDAVLMKSMSDAARAFAKPDAAADLAKIVIEAAARGRQR